MEMSAKTKIGELIAQSFVAALLAAVLFLHFIGLRTVDNAQGLSIVPEWNNFALCVAGVFVARFAFGIFGSLKTHESKKPLFVFPSNHAFYNKLFLAMFVIVVVLPFTPVSSRYVLDVVTLILTYMVLAYGLNLVVGLTGLLDLGFAAFYGLGAYAFALLALQLGLNFWVALPLASIIAGVAAFLIGITVLRLRGDYFAVVTLGFAEILRIVLLNWVSLTGGPNGINGVPRPSLFGLSFERAVPEGMKSFHEYVGLEFSSTTRVIFLYYLVLALVVLVHLLATRLRRLPLGRAFEAVREDERASEAVGINLTRTKLAAYVIAAAIGGAAGAFFAARQGFISPESFTFMESALVLAVVVLGGMGHPLGLAGAAIFLVGLPEIFRELQDYRMIAFGAGMVVIMLLRPSGLFSKREPAIRLFEK
ncbi:MAG: high-affinity branched-chain amino acid ABC transporter permease LivM [Alphaproteobacteria bacterium]|nr:high-affinity branched-chain amino acid ABC transporter permease LivM [Alphaproteobacteria bacterium]